MANTERRLAKRRKYVKEKLGSVMRTGVSGFQPERLLQARESLGITRVALATLVGVSPATISNWEKGSQLPEEDKLRALGEAVKFSMSWFLTDSPKHGGAPYFFRSLSSSTKTAREMAKVRLNWVAEMANILGQWVNWPKVNVPTISEEAFLKITDSEIEMLAAECRKTWKLGMGPISDVVLTLENAGVIFARDEIGHLKMDGVSHWSQIDDRPYVFVTADKANGIRSRFDAAHELGHLVLHRNIDESMLKQHYKEIERQADLFAGCFLLPAESFSLEVSWPTLETLLSLKPRWKVSVAAMIMRCYQLKIIDEDQKLRLFKGRSARGWTKGEPYDDQFAFEKPRLLNRAARMLVTKGILNQSELSHKLGLSEYLIESLCGLPSNFFSSQPIENNLVELKETLKERTGNQKTNNTGSILKFPANKIR
ncbi:helix-turn-helix domain-containing protein [Microbulbifer sp. PAAF003]|uniref:helix-turn-helix domain-containing protein n=1 Tax=Microbulbifer sp. PAAF003 TaxID=3243375 RepID=UPI00403A7777